MHVVSWPLDLEHMGKKGKKIIDRWRKGLREKI
jgi:hypothetical protein